MALLYFDSSALAKLVLDEPESAALWEVFVHEEAPVSSVLAAIEIPRAARRAAPGTAKSPAMDTQVAAVLDRLNLLALSPEIVGRSATLEPATLRSLDAIHLATALSLGRELEGIVVYDDRLASASRDAGLRVLAPGPE